MTTETAANPRVAAVGGHHRAVPRFGRLLTVLLMAALAAAWPARAQDEDALEMGMEALTRKGFEKYGSILRLDDDQKEAARMLFDGYIDGVRDAGKRMKAYMEELQEKAQAGDFSVYQTEMPAKMKEFQDGIEGLENGFFDDLKTLLREDQAAEWPRLERFRLREQGMQYGMIVSGAGVDLIAVADKLKMDTASNAALAEHLERYELDVDKQLVMLKRMAEEMQEDAMEAMGEFDMSKYSGMMEKIAAPARQIRDINRQYTRLIVPLLPAEEAERFEAEVRLRGFPRVYRKSHAARALAAAEGFGDLTDDQRAKLGSIRESYQRDLAAANEKWATEIEKKDNEGGTAIMERMMEQFGGGESDDPLSQARKARRELDDRTRERILEVLTEDQRTRLPEKGPTNDNPWDDYQLLQEGEEEDPGK